MIPIENVRATQFDLDEQTKKELVGTRTQAAQLFFKRWTPPLTLSTTVKKAFSVKNVSFYLYFPLSL